MFLVTELLFLEVTSVPGVVLGVENTEKFSLNGKEFIYVYCFIISSDTLRTARL